MGERAAEAVTVDRQELEEFLASAPESLREWADAQRAVASPGADEDAVPAAPVRTSNTAGPQQSSTARGINKVLVALLAAAIVLLVQQWGQPEPQPAAQAPQNGIAAGATGFGSLDEARVAELETMLEKDPDDIGAKRELAELHNDAGLWNEAADYHQQVLDQEPDDIDALLALGVIQFNMGDTDAAEASWLRAVDVDPQLPEPYFNLGFAYLGKEPAQNDRAKEMWEKLIAVAPDSELAQTAKSHIDGISGEEG